MPSKNLAKWLNSGESIPPCVNHGCDRNVAVRHWSENEGGIAKPSLKTECSRCSSARTKGLMVPGVTFHKKNYCENKDGTLGFCCPMNPDNYGEFPSDCYDMDHIDGDHHNNDPENLITLCKVCHARKGKEKGDFNSQKPSSRLHK